MKRALILTDIQNDFAPGGSLGVPYGDAVVPVANSLMDRFDIVVATQDWHPANHRSFASQHPGKSPGDIIDLDGLPQTLWPNHCVQDSNGAEFIPGLDIALIDKVVRKGTSPDVDSYSGFFDNGHRNATGLGNFLSEWNVNEVALVGLTTEYCVKFTALDAISLGFKTSIIIEGVRGVELRKGDCDKALSEAWRAGVMIVSIDDLGRRSTNAGADR